MANTESGNGFTLSGTLYRTFNTEAKQVGDKTYYSRKLVLHISEEYNGQDYHQYIPCELRGENKCSMLDRFEEGWKVKLHCNMRGVKYNPKDAPTEEKYFSNVDVWKMENMNGPAQQPTPQHQPTSNVGNSNYNSAPNFNPGPETIDDLPF